ncbi:MAG: hypothetical protein ABSG93_16690 [Solirubrobacteraceae bacterium]
MDAGRTAPIRAGTADPASPTLASSGNGRAFGPGRRRIFALAAIVLAIGLGVVALTAGHGKASLKLKYGGLPSWLPKSTFNPNEVLQASLRKPVLAIQGNTVSINLAGGHVLAELVGPTVPEDGKFPVPRTSPATFILTLSHASGVVPISPGAFALVDERGTVRHPAITAVGGGALPTRVPPGKTLSLRMHDVIPTGDGGLLWKPEGRHAIVSWDFNVEID